MGRAGTLVKPPSEAAATGTAAAAGAPPGSSAGLGLKAVGAAVLSAEAQAALKRELQSLLNLHSVVSMDDLRCAGHIQEGAPLPGFSRPRLVESREVPVKLNRPWRIRR